MMKNLLLIIVAVLTVGAWETGAQSAYISDADKTAIKQTALDYIEGWY